MSILTRATIKNFLIQKRGYIKKHPKYVARILWKNMPKGLIPKRMEDIKKELKLISQVQSDLRTATSLVATKDENDVMDVYNKLMEVKSRPKRRLFFDIEVSPNLVLSWRVGNKINLSHENIVDERAIICICYKWENEPQVHSLKWDKGDDKAMMIKFAKVIDSADEIVTQNGDAFDIKWLRTRCVRHNIKLNPKFNSIDTLKMARAGFSFNSNKLDYMAKFTGLDGKMKTDYDLWKNIVLKNCTSSMKTMIDYCKKDVVLLEQVYHRLQPFTPIKKFRYKI